LRTNSPLHRVRGPDHFFHIATPKYKPFAKRVGGMPDRQTKALNFRFARGGPMRDPERLAFAGACPAAVCRLVFNSVRIFGECCSRHTFARSFKASSSGSPQVRISILAKFACSFTHLATAASASCNQDGEVLLSSSQPCLSASESNCCHGLTEGT
jgi:hypothetical protein